MYKKILLLVSINCLAVSLYAQQLVSETQIPNSFAIVSASGNAMIYADGGDFTLIQKSASFLQQDIERVTGKKPELINAFPASAKNIIIIGSIEKSSLIQQLIQQKKINVDKIKNKWEAYQLQTLSNPFKGIESALVIVGSDRRGTAYGVFELSQQMGVSPWYWWADVPVKKKSSLYIKKGIIISDAPKVKYRGFFINDEAPAFSGWTKEKFGGVNHNVYEKIFELLLRLKANYLWPAMWGNAFNDDDTLNPKLADEYGIVMGTSHHEPMLRAQQEWKRYGKGQWNYDSNEVVLKQFWKKGIENMRSHESIVTIGMRGDGDKPMTQGTATALLERIVADQRKIIEDVTGKPASATPQLWALYKEVQDYYDQGMRVPDDVTLLLCDDNWGNIRKLPDINAPVHPGGYGMYYHVDYVGGPRCYKWLNVSQNERIWEQMNLAYSHGVDRLWVLNVGDLKPMEYPISFFLDMAWDPTQFNAQNIQQYSEDWCTQQFGEKYAKETSRLLELYTKYNQRVTPEILNANTYSLENYNEFERVRNEYRDLALDAMRLYYLIPNQYKDAFDQLVLFPVNACSNLYEMYYAVAENKKLTAEKNSEANYWADVAKQCYDRDSILTV